MKLTLPAVVSSAPSPIVTVTGLSKTYASGLKALKRIDLTIRRGEILALLGPNGAGKTTLINIICGIVTPSEGSVVADGHDQPRPVRQSPESCPLRESAAGSVAMGQKGLEDHDAFRRHEATRDDRKGAVARTSDPVPRRTDCRRRRRVAP